MNNCKDILAFPRGGGVEAIKDNIGNHCGAYNKAITANTLEGEYFFFELHKDTVPEFTTQISNHNGQRPKTPYINNVNGKDRRVDPIHVRLGNMVLNYFIISNVLDSGNTYEDAYKISITLLWPDMMEDMENIKLLPLGFLYTDVGVLESSSFSMKELYDISHDAKEITLRWTYPIDGKSANFVDDEICFQPDNEEHSYYFYTHENEGTYTKLFYKLIWN